MKYLRAFGEVRTSPSMWEFYKLIFSLITKKICLFSNPLLRQTPTSAEVCAGWARPATAAGASGSALRWAGAAGSSREESQLRDAWSLLP